LSWLILRFSPYAYTDLFAVIGGIKDEKGCCPLTPEFIFYKNRIEREKMLPAAACLYNSISTAVSCAGGMKTFIFIDQTCCR